MTWASGSYLSSRRVAAVFAVLLVLMILWHGYPAGTRPVVLDDQTIDVHGMQRRYRLVMPVSLSPNDHNELRPLIIALPGAGDSTQDMSRYTGLDQLAITRGCFIVYLEGRHLSWPPFVPPDNPDHIVPDLELFDAVCGTLGEQYGIDRRRIYVVGISQGGAFANLLVAKRSGSIAAAVCHSGWLPEPLSELGIHASRKTPMLFVVSGGPPGLAQLAQEGRRVFSTRGASGRVLGNTRPGPRLVSREGI